MARGATYVRKEVVSKGVGFGSALAIAISFHHTSVGIMGDHPRHIFVVLRDLFCPDPLRVPDSSDLRPETSC